VLAVEATVARQQSIGYQRAVGADEEVRANSTAQAVLASADDRHSGVASGVNNAVARVAGVIAVAVLPS